MPMTPNDDRSPQDPGNPAAGPACPSCGSGTLSGAAYCHTCGASLAGGAVGGKWPAGKFAGLAAVAGLIAVSVFVLVTFSTLENTPPSSSSSAPPTLVYDAPPDLSRMTQREAADRLFNRIMRASEQGNRAEAMRFVPMAIRAYDGLPALDRDAQYHLGLIYGVAGDRTKGDRHIAALRQAAPNHLLALILEHGIAERSGDHATVSKIVTKFATAYNSEMAMGRPEYQAHRNTIEKFLAAAKTTAALFPTEPVGSSKAGALLFAKNCAACHGREANGSDRGPPLVHKIYESSHHEDDAFFRAVRDGVRPHHWPFGAMPSIPSVSEDEVRQIIAYVRGLQRAAGIQ